MAFHSNGENVLGRDQINRIFQALDTVRSLPDYKALCTQSNYVDRDGRTTCEIYGVTKFWNHSADQFATAVLTDEQAIHAISSVTYPDGTPVDEQSVFGYPERNTNGTLTFSKLYLVGIGFPTTKETETFEKVALEALLDGVRLKWQQEEWNDFFIEVSSERSFSDE